MNDNIDGDKGVTWGEGVLGVPLDEKLLKFFMLKVADWPCNTYRNDELPRTRGRNHAEPKNLVCQMFYDGFCLQ